MGDSNQPACWGKTFWRGNWHAVRHGMLWASWRWVRCGASRKIEPLADCPWYVHPDEASRRAAGREPRRSVSELK